MKTRLLLTTIAVIALLQACVPTGGGTATSGTFNVNIKSGNYSNFGIEMLPPERKLLLIDGEGLDFNTYFTSNGFGGMEALFTITPPTSNTTYEYLSDSSQTYYFTTGRDICTALQTGKLIGNTLDSNLIWISCNTTNNTIIGFYESSIMTTALAPENIRVNEDRYFVFRKRSTSNVYTYFWIRVKYTGGIFYVYNGKFQRNSIITGQ